MAKNAAHRWEKWHPPALAAATTTALWLWGFPLAQQAVERQWKVDELYTAVFNIAGIYTAFLFTFYSFIATTDRGFIGRSKDSRYYRQTVNYTISALVLGGALCVLTLPILVIEPDLRSHAGRVVASSWVGLSVWASAAFVRAAYLFTIFARSQKA